MSRCKFDREPAQTALSHEEFQRLQIIEDYLHLRILLKSVTRILSRTKEGRLFLRACHKLFFELINKTCLEILFHCQIEEVSLLYPPLVSIFFNVGYGFSFFPYNLLQNQSGLPLEISLFTFLCSIFLKILQNAQYDFGMGLFILPETFLGRFLCSTSQMLKNDSGINQLQSKPRYRSCTKYYFFFLVSSKLHDFISSTCQK